MDRILGQCRFIVTYTLPCQTITRSWALLNFFKMVLRRSSGFALDSSCAEALPACSPAADSQKNHYSRGFTCALQGANSTANYRSHLPEHSSKYTLLRSHIGQRFLTVIDTVSTFNPVDESTSLAVIVVQHMAAERAVRFLLSACSATRASAVHDLYQKQAQPGSDQWNRFKKILA